MTGQQKGPTRRGSLAQLSCVICHLPSKPDDPVTIKLTDSKPKHVKCRDKEQEDK